MRQGSPAAAPEILCRKAQRAARGGTGSDDGHRDHAEKGDDVGYAEDVFPLRSTKAGVEEKAARWPQVAARDGSSGSAADGDYAVN